jgi:signal peptidase I
MQSQSMHPTIEAGDVILLEQRPPASGDIVAFLPPRSWTTDPTPFVKRVIGSAGDDINLVRGQVLRNGSVLEEPYALGPTEASDGPVRWQVPDGQLFVMGDDREKSADSRSFGSVPVGQVIGVATWRREPVVAKLTS